MGINLPKDVKGTVKIDDYYTIGKHTKLKFKSDKTTSKVNWDSFESVEMFFVVDYTLFKMGQNFAGPEASFGEGRFGFSTRWKATFTDSGLELEKDGVQPKANGIKKHEGMIVVAATGQAEQSKTTVRKPFVEVAISLIVSVSDPGIDISAGFLGTGVSRNVRANQESVSTEIERRIIFDIDNPPEDVEVKIPRSLLEPAPLFFKENESSLSPQSLTDLYKWVNLVKDVEALLAVIVQGKLKIEIEAFASTTGNPNINKKETDRRLESVKKTLRMGKYFGSSAVDFDPLSHGDSKAVSRGAKEAWNRRVEIKLDKSKAIKAIKALKSKK